MSLPVDGRLGPAEILPPSVGGAAARKDVEELAAAVTAEASQQPAGPSPAGAPAGFTVALTGADLGIPTRVLAAYREAARRIAAERPGCNLSWAVLAGIGRVESGHAIGRRISPDGTVSPAILGPRLDGAPGTARILDTDRGALDQDTVLDRAVGPMQFIPSTWRWAGRDASGDGMASPNNIDDATLAAAGYLCRSGDLSIPSRLSAAVRSYNPSDAYVRSVLTWAAGYASADPADVDVAAAAADEAAPTPAAGVEMGTPAEPNAPAAPTGPAEQSPPPAAAPGAATPGPSPAGPLPTGGLPTLPPGPAGPPVSVKPLPPATSPACPSLTLVGESVSLVAVEPSVPGAGPGAVDVRGQIRGADGGTVIVRVALVDSAEHPVLSVEVPVPLPPGTAPVTLARLPGWVLMPAGTPGAFQLEIGLRPAATGCPAAEPVTVPAFAARAAGELPRPEKSGRVPL